MASNFSMFRLERIPTTEGPGGQTCWLLLLYLLLCPILPLKMSNSSSLVCRDAQSPTPSKARLPVAAYSGAVMLLFSPAVLSDSLRPHGLQHAGLPCPSPSPRACSNSRPLSQGCHPTISFSVAPFSSFPQSFPYPSHIPASPSLSLECPLWVPAITRLPSCGCHSPVQQHPCVALAHGDVPFPLLLDHQGQL